MIRSEGLFRANRLGIDAGLAGDLLVSRLAGSHSNPALRYGSSELLGKSCRTARRHLNNPIGRSLDPAQLDQPFKERCTQSPRQVMAPLAPVQAGAAQGSARYRQLVDVDAEREEVPAPRGRKLKGPKAGDELAITHSVKERHSALSCQMVVADARTAQGRLARTDDSLRTYLALCQAHQSFEDLAHFGTRKAKVVMASLALDFHQIGVMQLSKMTTRRLQGDGSSLSQFAHRQSASIHQGEQDQRTGRISQQGGHGCDAGMSVHGSMLAEVFLQIKV